MQKVTNAVLAEKIDALNEKLDLFKEELQEVKIECKSNTEFRQKATGVTAVVGFFGAVFGGVAVWLLNKLW